MASQNTGDIITAPQTVTATFTDLGSEIEVLGYSFFMALIELNINDSKNIQFRFRILNESGGNEYIMPLKTVRSDNVLLDDFAYELNSDSDQNIVIETEIDQSNLLVKVQVRAKTLGATAAIINTAKFRQGYRQ